MRLAEEVDEAELRAQLDHAQLLGQLRGALAGFDAHGQDHQVGERHVEPGGGLDAFQRFVKRLPEGCELRVSNLEFQPLRTMARAGVQPIPGRLSFYPNREAALADL